MYAILHIKIVYWLIVFCYSTVLEAFHSYGDVTMPMKGWKLRALLGLNEPLSWKGSLEFHIYSDRRNAFVKSPQTLTTYGTLACGFTEL